MHFFKNIVVLRFRPKGSVILNVRIILPMVFLDSPGIIWKLESIKMESRKYKSKASWPRIKKVPALPYARVPLHDSPIHTDTTIHTGVCTLCALLLRSAEVAGGAVTAADPFLNIKARALGM